MSSINSYRKIKALLSLFDYSPRSYSAFAEEAEDRITYLSTDEIFSLAREYMRPARKIAIKVLRRAVEVELFLLTVDEMISRLGEGNPPILEKAFLYEFKKKRHEITTEDIKEILWSFRDETIRRSFLCWVANTFYFRLHDLVFMRQQILFPVEWISDKATRRELSIIDEAIKLTLLNEHSDAVKDSIALVKGGRVFPTELPDFFVPLLNRFHPQLNLD